VLSSRIRIFIVLCTRGKTYSQVGFAFNKLHGEILGLGSVWWQVLGVDLRLHGGVNMGGAI
jgi:hypothetical protein